MHIMYMYVHQIYIYRAIIYKGTNECDYAWPECYIVIWRGACGYSLVACANAVT